MREARLSLSLALVGFCLAAASGLLNGTQPEELLGNRAFTLKMLLLFAAGGAMRRGFMGAGHLLWTAWPAPR